METTRKHPRFPLDARIRLRVAEAEHRGRSRNVSRGGLCLEVRDHVDTGQEALVDLTLQADQKPLTLVGRVVWCTSFGDAHQVGVQFGPMSTEQASSLEQFLNSLLH